MKPKQYFYVILGIIGGLLALGGTGYYFALKMINETSQTAAANYAAQVTADEKLDSLSKLQNQYTKEIEPILPLMDQALPRTKNQTAILSQLHSIAGESGLALGSITFPSAAGLPNDTSQTVVSGGVLALPVNFTVSGSYTQLQSFLRKVETLSRFTNVTNLSVTRPDKSRPIIYTMTVNAYVKL